MEMEIQVERVAEALHEGDRAALGVREVPACPRAAPQRCKDNDSQPPRAALAVARRF
jgi:hypothetical protein